LLALFDGSGGQPDPQGAVAAATEDTFEREATVPVRLGCDKIPARNALGVPRDVVDFVALGSLNCPEVLHSVWGIAVFVLFENECDLDV
jgi:hypothetical protein